MGVMVGAWAIGAASGAAADAPKAYVGVFQDDAVAVIDTSRHQVVATIAVPRGPHGVAITPDGRKVYVSSDGASTVSVIDTSADRAVAPVDVDANPHGLAISGDGSSPRAGARTVRSSSGPRPIA
jgi:YVTN family beta-propeller protein